MLPVAVPAGLPARGVDFGLDAVAASRSGAIQTIRFSTEILFRGKPPFTDGDVLMKGNGVEILNYDLIKAFEPHARFLGLDALHIDLPGRRALRLSATDLEDTGAEAGKESHTMSAKRLSLIVSLVMLAALCLGASGMPAVSPPNPRLTRRSARARTAPSPPKRTSSPATSSPSMATCTSRMGTCSASTAMCACATTNSSQPGSPRRSSPPDLGLDALDILDVSAGAKPIIAFSTEVDHPGPRFTAGDLLFTPGWAIPNIALVRPFNITWDIGLDGVQFMGKIENIMRFVNTLPNHPREQFLQNPGMLQTLLKEYSIDIWFTVEGTAAIGTRSQVLDGDLLSAATGTIVVPQSALLPGDVPAGLLQRGVDFGLDAVVGPRDPTSP